LQQQYPDKKFKTNPVSGEVTEDTTPEGGTESFEGSELYDKIENTKTKEAIRENIARLEYGDVIDVEGNVVDVRDVDGYDIEAAMERRRQYLKKWKGEVPGEVKRVRGGSDTAQPPTDDDFETAKTIFMQNYDALAADNAIEEIPIEGRPNWVRVRFPDPATGLFHEFIVEKNI
jgi:hypothetical protein